MTSLLSPQLQTVIGGFAFGAVVITCFSKLEIEENPEPLDLKPSVFCAHKIKSGTDEELLAAMEECPSSQTMRNVANLLQIHGFAVIDDFFPQPAHDMISAEVEKAISGAVTGDDPVSATITETGPFLDMTVKVISDTFRTRLTDAITDWHTRHDWDNVKSIYWHKAVILKEFEGFQAKQLRLRAVGSNLGLHLDRTSAVLTVLYYPNKTWEGGELVVYTPHPSKHDSAFKEEFDQKLSAVITDFHPVTVEPKGNRLLVFWSDSVPHEVLKIKAPRLSFQVFFSGDFYDLVVEH
eukprot:TRINITY_DN3641_c0_g3_i1.p1 TRINITY_DN3641_c0_g3~~TRINITY_DN3641_c0_g3_i1.p1  ORF type:complete len:301 (-),score=49.56 TRINITY_DN3641_c0_g3_i1:40-921(-)